ALLVAVDAREAARGFDRIERRAMDLLSGAPRAYEIRLSECDLSGSRKTITIGFGPGDLKRLVSDRLCEPDAQRAVEPVLARVLRGARLAFRRARPGTAHRVAPVSFNPPLAGHSKSFRRRNTRDLNAAASAWSMSSRVRGARAARRRS